jgi:hypothetical protein
MQQWMARQRPNVVGFFSLLLKSWWNLHTVRAQRLAGPIHQLCSVVVSSVSLSFQDVSVTDSHPTESSERQPPKDILMNGPTLQVLVRVKYSNMVISIRKLEDTSQILWLSINREGRTRRLLHIHADRWRVVAHHQ